MKLYLMMTIGALILGAYFYGVNITNAKCSELHTQNNLNQIKQLQQNKKDIYETVYKTGMADIRRILCDKYSIAE